MQCVQCDLGLVMLHAGVLDIAVDQRREDKARMNRIDTDLVRSEGQCIVFRHRAHRALGGVIRRNIGAADDAVDRRDIDDGPATGLAHRCNGVFGAQEDGGRVDSHHPLPIGKLELVGRFVDAFNAGVVDQHIKPAELADGGLDGCLHLRFAGYVTGMERRLVPGSPELLCHFVAPRVAVDDQHRAALFAHALCNRCTQTVGATRDQCNLVLKPGHLDLPGNVHVERSGQCAL